jgi:outer membrane lipoprotein-sorting protein
MTTMDWCKYLLCASAAAAMALPVSAAEQTMDQTRDQALARMDQAAAHFKGLSANVEYVQHMQAIHEDDAQTGTILVKRAKPKEVHVRISIEKPEPKTAVVDGKKVEAYYPRSGQRETASLDRQSSLVGMILMLGFGGTSKELQTAYVVTLGGVETVAGESATRLELIPKSKEMLEQWKKIDLWISDKSGYAVQQKFYERGNDYLLITYTNVQPKPDIADSAFHLDVPKGTPTEPLNKKK